MGELLVEFWITNLDIHRVTDIGDGLQLGNTRLIGIRVIIKSNIPEFGEVILKPCIGKYIVIFLHNSRILSIGQDITVKGSFLPLRANGKIKFFLLVPEFGACIGIRVGVVVVVR